MSFKRVGYCFTGSFCTFSRSLAALKRLCTYDYDIVPIMSETAYYTDTRFALAEEFSKQVESITGKKIIHTVPDAEPLGPKDPLDLLIISPCTGNTLAKISNGITDTAATMAAKAHMRQDRPLLLALASNDAMSQNLSNISKMLTRKSVYFVPMLQDSPKGKPYSLVADFDRMEEAIDAVEREEQLRPVFL